jgi:hypothetical protein
MNQEEAPLLVELFLQGARIKGLCAEVGRRTRLVEVLNTPGDVLQLEAAVVTMASASPLQSLDLTIEKSSIIAAIPWETPEQIRHRELATSMTGRAQTSPIEIVSFSPPYAVSGTAHVAGGFGVGLRSMRADPSVFSHFFSITNAQMTLPDGSKLDAPVILVNRERVSAMARAIQVASASRLA